MSLSLKVRKNTKKNNACNVESLKLPFLNQERHTCTSKQGSESESIQKQRDGEEKSAMEQ